MKLMTGNWITALLLSLALTTLTASRWAAPAARGQSLCPTGIAFGSSNGTVSIDSAIAVVATGCPSGTGITFYVDIPSSSDHPCGGSGQPVCWHSYMNNLARSVGDPNTTVTAWVDLSRNESHPTEFPDGDYSFFACASQCLQSATYYLGTPAGAAGGAFNPWAPPESNMQWKQNLCIFLDPVTHNCDTGSQNMQGEELAFVANTDSSPGPGSTLYQNLNGFFSNPNPPNPADPQDAPFTQLVVNHYTDLGYDTLFYEFTNDVVYCAADSSISVANPSYLCDWRNRTPDNLTHTFWMEINPTPAQCKDTRYPCLQVYFDGSYFAEERMQNGGDLYSPFIQNEMQTPSDISVWAAQLSYVDYSSMNQNDPFTFGLDVDFKYDFTQYEDAQGNWAQFFFNLPNNGPTNRSIRNLSSPGTTFGVYCGAFSAAYPWPGNPNQSSAMFGTQNLSC